VPAAKIGNEEPSSVAIASTSAGLILMLVVGQWVAAGFMAFFLAMALVSGARSRGTHAQRFVAWLRRRSADA